MGKFSRTGARLWIEVEPQHIVERVYFSDGDYGPPPEVVQQRARFKNKKSKVKKRKPKNKGNIENKLNN